MKLTQNGTKIDPKIHDFSFCLRKVDFLRIIVFLWKYIHFDKMNTSICENKKKLKVNAKIDLEKVMQK